MSCKCCSGGALDLSAYGISDVKDVCYNLSYDELYKEETMLGLEGLEKGFVTNTGALNVDTGIYTGRSPKDKYIVKEETSEKNVWWAAPNRKGSDNKPISEETWKSLKQISQKQLSGKKLYVVDAFCGANPNTRLSLRLVTEIAWAAHL